MKTIVMTAEQAVSIGAFTQSHENATSVHVTAKGFKNGAVQVTLLDAAGRTIRSAIATKEGEVA